MEQKLKNKDDHFTVNLRVADTRYPIRIKRNEEEVFRRAAKEVDYKLSQYKNYFTGQSSQPLRDVDYMAMTAIQAVSGKVEDELKINELESKVREMINLIDSCLIDSN